MMLSIKGLQACHICTKKDCSFEICCCGWIHHRAWQQFQGSHQHPKLQHYLPQKNQSTDGKSTRTWEGPLQHHKNTVAIRRVISSWYCTCTLEQTQQLASISKRASSYPKNLHKSTKSASILKRLRLLYRDLWTNIISWRCLIPTLEQSNWQRAESILKDKTWEITDLPLGITLITSKSICKTKSSADGKIEKHKASLAAQGFEQTKGPWSELSRALPRKRDGEFDISTSKQYFSIEKST
jgi:hypothetical protein